MPSLTGLTGCITHIFKHTQPGQPCLVAPAAHDSMPKVVGCTAVACETTFYHGVYGPSGSRFWCPLSQVKHLVLLG